MYDVDMLFERFHEMKEIMGAEALLVEIYKSMSSEEKFETLEFIDRMYDLGLFEDEIEGGNGNE